MRKKVVLMTLAHMGAEIAWHFVHQSLSMVFGTSGISI